MFSKWQLFNLLTRENVSILSILFEALLADVLHVPCQPFKTFVNYFNKIFKLHSAYMVFENPMMLALCTALNKCNGIKHFC